MVTRKVSFCPRDVRLYAPQPATISSPQPAVWRSWPDRGGEQNVNCITKWKKTYFYAWLIAVTACMIFSLLPEKCILSRLLQLIFYTLHIQKNKKTVITWYVSFRYHIHFLGNFNVRSPKKNILNNKLHLKYIWEL